ncbi:PTS-dependent dihydroxyacetone kinase, ADP-binding subunit DhaL [Eubacterium limosum]|uniref:phosphoenolpyruvate--glycerone phosphotransferase n=1 Tax=Eubacterium limosum TaxID=1736 RepID=A0A6N3HEV4_EUBLI
MLNKQDVYQMLEKVTDVFNERKEFLSELDAKVGDGDHGYSIARGCTAGMKAISDLDEQASISDLFRVYGRTLTCEVGGAMGPLFGLIFTEMGVATQKIEVFGVKDLLNGLNCAKKEILELGGASPGDKTMVDAIVPTVETLKQAIDTGKTDNEVLTLCVDAAKKGVEATIPMVARRGRSKYLREKSVGYQDAGATSFYTLIGVLAESLKEN